MFHLGCVNELDLMSHQHTGHKEKEPQLKVSSKRPEKFGGGGGGLIQKTREVWGGGVDGQTCDPWMGSIAPDPQCSLQPDTLMFLWCSSTLFLLKTFVHYDCLSWCNDNDRYSKS